MIFYFYIKFRSYNYLEGDDLELFVTKFSKIRTKFSNVRAMLCKVTI